MPLNLRQKGRIPFRIRVPYQSGSTCVYHRGTNYPLTQNTDLIEDNLQVSLWPGDAGNHWGVSHSTDFSLKRESITREARKILICRLIPIAVARKGLLPWPAKGYCGGPQRAMGKNCRSVDRNFSFVVGASKFSGTVKSVSVARALRLLGYSTTEVLCCTATENNIREHDTTSRTECF